MSILYRYQQKIKDLILEGRSIILQAPTGAGKTLAALAPFIENYWSASHQYFPRKCVYAVPMRVLANQFYIEYEGLKERYQRLHKRSFDQYPLEILRQTGEYKEDREFRADMTFATIDQVLSGWLMTPYSLPNRLGNLNAGAFVGSYLIFDEFHLFDPDSTLPTTLHMLKVLNGISPFVLMTATFSKEMLEKLAHHLNAEAFLLTDEMLAEIPAQKKERKFYTTAVPLTFKNDDKQVLAEETAVAHILQTHQRQTIEKPRTLVVCNQVERAQAISTALREQKPDGVTVRLLHSRFLKEDRQTIEDFVRDEFQKDTEKRTVPSLIVVATQVVEVGLDMSAAVLHTELAPAASVLQRAGRCARYPGESGQVYVYPLDEDGYAPYHGTHAKQQCDLTWDWLAENQDRHLAFADEQALINHAHTASDNMILNSVFGAEYEHTTAIWAAWRGE
ncbi:MAG: CRISPR-associated helicase Cas3', partial [Anaerolineales bacterium]|nr:CRISPR-associated helicase Cas3' [Anaerolineales bacterium]